MSKLHARIERMEKKVEPGDSVEAIFRHIVGAVDGRPLELPVLGWRYYHDKELVDVVRLDGESDEKLEMRAMTMARQHMPVGQGIPVMMQIHE